MPHYVPITSPFGRLDGRDCIYLDRMVFEDGPSTLVLEGSLNGYLCAATKDVDFIPFKLVFNIVLATKTIELDSWDYGSDSSFDEIVDSDWIRNLGGKVTSEYRHFLVQTYDFVIEVVCKDYEFTVENHSS